MSDCLMTPSTSQWLPDNCLMTAWQLPDNCLTTAWQLPDDCLTTAWWLPDNCAYLIYDRLHYRPRKDNAQNVKRWRKSWPKTGIGPRGACGQKSGEFSKCIRLTMQEVQNCHFENHAFIIDIIIYEVNWFISSNYDWLLFFGNLFFTENPRFIILHLQYNMMLPENLNLRGQFRHRDPY